jgi:hypothetical protein
MATTYEQALQAVNDMFINRDYSLEQCLGNLGALEDVIIGMKEGIEEDIRNQQL